MRIEFAAVRRALRASGLHAVKIHQTGIGRDAILRTISKLLDEQHTAAHPIRGIVLAGACGALMDVPDVPPISAIIDQHGQRWSVSHGCLSGADTPGVTLIAVDEIVSTPAAKSALAARTGAAIVDMESHIFAAECHRRGLAWHVVRGVSDTPRETLPDEVLQWIDPQGNTRSMRAVADMARRPRLLPHIVAVVRRSNRVLPQVGTEVARVITSWARSGAQS